MERKNVTLSDEFSPSSTSSAEMSGLVAETKLPERSHSLALSSDEIFDDGQSPRHSPHSPFEWSTQQVTNWLMSLNLEHCVTEFTAHNINGEQLLQLDSSKLKALGVNPQDKLLIKKKIKDMRVTVEKLRKANEKREKQKERLRKKEYEQEVRRPRRDDDPPTDGARSTPEP